MLGNWFAPIKLNSFLQILDWFMPWKWVAHSRGKKKVVIVEKRTASVTMSIFLWCTCFPERSFRSCCPSLLLTFVIWWGGKWQTHSDITEASNYRFCLYWTPSGHNFATSYDFTTILKYNYYLFVSSWTKMLNCNGSIRFIKIVWLKNSLNFQIFLFKTFWSDGKKIYGKSGRF